MGWGVCPEELGVQGLRMEGLFQPEAFELLEVFVGFACEECGDSSLSSLLCRLTSRRIVRLLSRLLLQSEEVVLFVRDSS